jgi:SAM-dependent methyltransferase
VIDSLVDELGLTGNDVVIDLGCGTGQLTLPVAARVRAVIGVDPEPDMLARARLAAAELGTPNVSWVIGADTGLPALTALLGEAGVGAVTIAQALHWMNYEALFPALISMVRDGGGVAVVTNGTPLWLQDTPWSRALSGFLEQWFGTKLTSSCGTDAESQRRYRDSLAAAGLDVRERSVEYASDLDLRQVVGGLYSAFAVDRLPAPDQRPDFAEQIRCALAPHESFTEHVRVAMLFGIKRPAHCSPGPGLAPVETMLTCPRCGGVGA